MTDCVPVSSNLLLSCILLLLLGLELCRLTSFVALKKNNSSLSVRLLSWINRFFLLKEFWDTFNYGFPDGTRRDLLEWMFLSVLHSSSSILIVHVVRSNHLEATALLKLIFCFTLRSVYEVKYCTRTLFPYKD